MCVCVCVCVFSSTRVNALLKTRRAKSFHSAFSILLPPTGGNEQYLILYLRLNKIIKIPSLISILKYLPYIWKKDRFFCTNVIGSLPGVSET